MMIRFLLVLFYFSSSFVNIKCAGSKRGRDEWSNSSLAEDVFVFCGKRMDELSVDDMDALRKINSALYDAIHTEWAVQLFGPGHQVKDGILHRPKKVLSEKQYNEAAKKISELIQQESTVPSSATAAYFGSVKYHRRSPTPTEKLSTESRCSEMESSPLSTSTLAHFADPEEYLRS